MKMKRYSAPDIRQAISQVREELGPDAVILSNRSTDDGVELIAAIDYDETIFNDQSSTAKSKKKTESIPAKPQTKSKAAVNPPSKATIPTSLAKELARTAEPSFANAKKTTVEPQAETQISKEWLSAFKAKFAIDEDIKEDTVTVSTTTRGKSSGHNDADIKNLRGELNHLRDLLENQLSSLAWQDVSKRYPQRAKAIKMLFEMGVTSAISKKVVESINFGSNFDTAWNDVTNAFANLIPVRKNDIVQKGGVFALVGPTGIGKTTTIAKIAARYALNHGTKGIALVTTDNYRIGAQEQLRTYGRILGAPVRVVNDAMELRKTLKSLYDKQLVLIDTAGMSQRDVRITEQFAMLSEGSSLIKTYLVLSAAAQTQVADETVTAFSKAVLDGCIISKLDESSTIGGALSVAVKHQLPIAYISDGQRVPEDLYVAESADLVKRCLASLNSDKESLDEESLEFLAGGMTSND